MLAVLWWDRHIRETVKNHGGRVALPDMREGARITDGSLIASGRHQRLRDVLHIGRRIKRNARGQRHIRLGGGKERDVPSGGVTGDRDAVDAQRAGVVAYPADVGSGVLD